MDKALCLTERGVDLSWQQMFLQNLFSVKKALFSILSPFPFSHFSFPNEEEKTGRKRKVWKEILFHFSPHSFQKWRGKERKWIVWMQEREKKRGMCVLTRSWKTKRPCPSRGWTRSKTIRFYQRLTLNVFALEKMRWFCWNNKCPRIFPLSSLIQSPLSSPPSIPPPHKEEKTEKEKVENRKK